MKRLLLSTQAQLGPVPQTGIHMKQLSPGPVSLQKPPVPPTTHAPQTVGLHFGGAGIGALVGVSLGASVVGVGAATGAVVVFLDFFAAFFFADLAVMGAADTVGAALMVGWFVGFLVLDPFLFVLVFFWTRRIIMLGS